MFRLWEYFSSSQTPAPSKQDPVQAQSTQNSDQSPAVTSPDTVSNVETTSKAVLSALNSVAVPSAPDAVASSAETSAQVKDPVISVEPVSVHSDSSASVAENSTQVEDPVISAEPVSFHSDSSVSVTETSSTAKESITASEPALGSSEVFNENLKTAGLPEVTEQELSVSLLAVDKFGGTPAQEISEIKPAFSKNARRREKQKQREAELHVEIAKLKEQLDLKEAQFRLHDALFRHKLRRSHGTQSPQVTESKCTSSSQPIASSSHGSSGYCESKLFHRKKVTHKQQPTASSKGPSLSRRHAE